MPALTPLASRRREISGEASREAFREDGPPLAGQSRAGRPDAGRSRAGRPYRRGFWLVGFVFLVTMAFSAVPAPLYVLYAARDHFGPLMITVIFAAYAVGVIASLFLAGHLSDWLGRRRMAVIAVAVNVASAVIFLLWPSVRSTTVGCGQSGRQAGPGRQRVPCLGG
jgi:hypothetical protein